jgi:hypothetical protein
VGIKEEELSIVSEKALKRFSSEQE